MIEKLEEKFTKYEIARILGARSLQLSMDAPILLKLTKEQEIKLAPLASDIYNPPNLAKALNIIDPITFKNTDYWTALLTKLVPFYSRLFPSTE